MPRIRLLARMNIEGRTREFGEEVDVHGDVASYLTRMSRAEIVRGEQPETPERKRRSPEKSKRQREVETR